MADVVKFPVTWIYDCKYSIPSLLDIKSTRGHLVSLDKQGLSHQRLRYVIAVPCNHHHVNSISILCISFMLDHQYISACVSVEHHLDYMSITIIIML